MRQQIDRGLYLYLDLVRPTAALVVALGHAQVSGLIWLPTYVLLGLAPSAVITFFVLSGLIIHATTDRTARLSPSKSPRRATCLDAHHQWDPLMHPFATGREVESAVAALLRYCWPALRLRLTPADQQ